MPLAAPAAHQVVTFVQPIDELRDVLGLILQMDSLWQSTTETSDSLEHLDERLSDLKQTTTLMSRSSAGPGQSFYAHLAEGAGPELLLSDLKGQLDLLAQQMANEKR